MRFVLLALLVSGIIFGSFEHRGSRDRKSRGSDLTLVKYGDSLEPPIPAPKP